MPRGQGRVPPAPLGGPTAGGRPGPWVAPQAALRHGGVIFCIKFPVNFEGNPTMFPVVTFLKYKTAKTGN